MAEPVKDIIRWLKTLDAKDAVGVDEDGLTLRSVDDPDAYFEIGGLPEEDEDEK